MEIPFGYKVIDHRLVIDEEAAPIVALAFQMCADGKTAKEIFDFLRLKGLRRADGKLLISIREQRQIAFCCCRLSSFESRGGHRF